MDRSSAGDKARDAQSLERLQQWMQAVITHPGGVTAGINSSSARDEIDVTSDDVEQVVERSRALSSIERLEIYGNAYYARLLECLGESFPVLRQTVGDEAFGQFAVGYLQRYPSTSYTLGRLGAEFANYLEETRPDREGRGDDAVWFDLLVDLARLEWAIAEVFDGPGTEDEPPLSPADVAAIPADRWPMARLVLAPCLRLIEFRTQVNDYFTAARAAMPSHEQVNVEIGEASALPWPEPGPCYVALTRIRYVVRRLPLSRPQYDLLSALLAGRSVGAAIEETIAIGRGDIEEWAGELRNWFAEWAAAGLFLRIEFGA